MSWFLKRLCKIVLSRKKIKAWLGIFFLVRNLNWGTSGKDVNMSRKTPVWVLMLFLCCFFLLTANFPKV